MKRIKVLLVFVFCMFVIPTVYAGTAYVDSINIDAKIYMDGSMEVVETINWDIDETLNGLYRDILITGSSNELNSASGIDINSVVVDGKTFSYSSSTLQNGTSGQYNVNDITGGKQVKIFTPSEDEYKKTVITYTLYDVIVEYNDIAELYWNFIGSGWDYGIDDVNINISLPGEAETLKIFGHGPLNGYSEITSINSATLTVSNLRSGEQVDARVLFDNFLVTPKKVVNENKLESILSEEAELAVEANLKREATKKAFYGAIVTVVIAIMIPIIVYVSARKKALKPTFNGKYYRELPEDYGPAIMNKVLYPTIGTASSNDMLATVLDLVRRKYVEIEPIVKAGKKKPSDYLLKLVKTDLSELNESEKYFIQNLIFVDTNEIALKELEKKNSKSTTAQTKAYEAYTKWTEIISELAKEKELLKAEKVKIGKDILKCLIAVVLTVIVVVYGAINNYEDILGIGMIGIFISIVELALVGANIHELNIRTQKGVEHNAMWKAFKKFLLDFSKLDERDYKSIAIWEHYLVYATALGVSKQVIRELKIVYPTEFEEGSNMLNTYATINLLSDNNAFSTFSNSFTSAASTAFSSPSSSNGSGGGFSGGAGGRRRRWWRRRILASKKGENYEFIYNAHVCVRHSKKKIKPNR